MESQIINLGTLTATALSATINTLVSLIFVVWPNAFAWYERKEPKDKAQFMAILTIIVSAVIVALTYFPQAGFSVAAPTPQAVWAFIVNTVVVTVFAFGSQQGVYSGYGRTIKLQKRAEARFAKESDMVAQLHKITIGQSKPEDEE